MSEKLWATPRSYSFNTSHRPGLTTLDCQVRGLYPEQERYHGVSTDLNQLTLFAEAFPVSRTPWLVDVVDLPTSVISGPRSPDSFARLDPDGSWRKTCQGYSQVTLDGSLAPFSETWPRAGMTRNGIAFRLQPSAPLTDVTASGSWPTPTVSDVMGTTEFHPRKESKPETNHATTLAQKVQYLERLPTPTAVTNTGGSAMCKWGGSGARARLREMFSETELNGALNPTWVEWLMGYPLGWTVCADWVTRSCLRLSSGSRKGLSRRRKKIDDADLHGLSGRETDQ